MKIYIGPYRDWIGPYQIAEKLLFWMKKDDDCIWKFGEWLSKSNTLCRICDWIDSMKNRKTEIRIDKYDTWNMDHTLALIVLPMLKQLKATKHGSPCTDDEDVPENLRSTAAEPKENEWDTDSNHFKRWDWVMDEMIYAFEMEIDEDWDLRIYEKHGNDWPPEALAERKVIQDRIQNGFRLFGKYYQGLWD